MDIILKILLQLGANQTVFIQFVLFVVTISFMTFVVYAPFFKAYDKRMQQTKGADQVAYETQEEAKKLESIYKTKAREINEKIKAIFDNAKTATTSKTSEMINAGKQSVASTTDSARAKILTQKQGAAKEVSAISEEIAQEISKKLTGTI